MDLAITGLRSDGRKPNELRRTSVQLGVLPRGDGSCTLEQGFTRVAAMVQGPRETSPGNAGIFCQVSFAPYAGAERRKPRGAKERRAIELATLLEGALTPLVLSSLFVRSRIDIQINVIQTDGSINSTAFNACVLALMDAGVPMLDFGVACTVAYYESTILLDPNQNEAQSSSELWVAVLPRSMQILTFGVNGKMSTDTFERLTATAQQGCSQLFGILEGFVVKSIR